MFIILRRGVVEDSSPLKVEMEKRPSAAAVVLGLFEVPVVTL